MDPGIGSAEPAGDVLFRPLVGGVGEDLPDGAPALFPGGDPGHPEPFLGQVVPQQLHDVCLILHHQEGFFSHGNVLRHLGLIEHSGKKLFEGMGGCPWPFEKLPQK
jgi:hypothetical protein